MPGTYIGRSATPTTASASTTTMNVSNTLDSGAIALGDQLLLVLVTPSDAGTAVPSAPAGWTQIVAGVGGGSAHELWAWTKSAVSADTSATTYPITFSPASNAGTRYMAWVAAVRPGAAESVTWRVATSGQAAATTGGTVTSPSCTGGNSGDPVLRVVTGLGSNITGSDKVLFDWAGSTPNVSAIKQYENTLFLYAASFASHGQVATGSAQALTVAMTKNSNGTTAQLQGQTHGTFIAESGALGTPVNTVAPAITGTAQQGQVVTCSTGTWTNSPTGYTYQWKRAGSAISGATASTYTLQAADVGQTITCTVTATNGSGSASATSGSIIPTALPAPVNTVAPAITGTAQQGQTVSCSQGTWTNSPTGYTYQWKRAGLAISGATTSTYTLQAVDVGQAVTCVVAATNAGGSTAATSNTVTPLDAFGFGWQPMNLLRYSSGAWV